MGGRVRRISGAFAAVLWLAIAPTSLHAQTAEATPVEPDFKGTIGLGLVGAELGFVIPAVAGLHETWAFVVFPIVGAGGGGAAGYFLIEKGTDSPELSVAMLATGMALIIPSMILTLSATAYDPEDELIEADRAGPQALVRVTERGVSVGTPAVGFSPAERRLGVALVSGRL